MALLVLPPADHLWIGKKLRVREAPAECWHRAELRTPGAAAQTRMVSVARIRLGSWESARAFKGIISDDVSEFESVSIAIAV
jgi:hypothetical protein